MVFRTVFARLYNSLGQAFGTLANPFRVQSVGTSDVVIAGGVPDAVGYSTYSFLSTAAVQAANIKAGPGNVYGLHFFNSTASICYVRLYNQTTAPASTDTPIYRAMIPASTDGAGFVVEITGGVAFTVGIGVRVTAGAADSDTTALSANGVMGNVFWD